MLGWTLTIDLDSGRRIRINDDTPMWNSGVIGSSHENKHLLDDVLSLYTRFYKINPSWHSEQFCFSIILSETAKLESCRSYIFHYWHNKNLANQYLLKTKDIGISGDGYPLGMAHKNACKIVVYGRIKYYFLRTKEVLRHVPLCYFAYKALKTVVTGRKANSGVNT